MKQFKLIFALGLLMTTISAWASIDITGKTGDYKLTKTGETITGTGDIRLIVPNGYNVYLLNCTIKGKSGATGDGVSGAGIYCEGNAGIYTYAGSKCYVYNSDANSPAIYCSASEGVEIGGDGELTAECKASGTGRAAAIGAGYEKSCGNIVIAGGTVIAKGGQYGAGIGGGYNSSCGNLVIRPEVVKVQATRGASATCSFGKGYGTSKCGEVYIDDLKRTDEITKQTYTFTPWDGNLANVSDHVVAHDGVTITGNFSSSASSKYSVNIAGGAKVTLSNAGMPTNVSTTNKWAMINCLGSATIMLDLTNSIGYINGDYPSIYVPKNCNLTIDSEKSGDYAGELDVTNAENVAIGSGYRLDGGSITIKGGIINAHTHSSGVPAIGGGAYANCQGVTIMSTVTKLTASRFSENVCTIGRADNGTCGDVRVAGVLYPNGIADNPFVYPTPAWDGNLSKVTSDVVAENGTIIRGTLNERHKITIADGATVWLSNANINTDDNTSYVSNGFAALQCEGNATIGLDTKTVNYVKSFCSGWSGIYVPQGKTLTIKGTGKLTAEGVSDAAGIGGPYDTKCGNIIIEDGEIIANGVSGAPGIGGGRLNSCGDITINGGTITATGGIDAVGIGCGYGGTCGKIKISGEVTKLTATRGTHDAEVVYCIGESVSFSTYTSTCGGVWIGDTKVSDKGIKGSLGGNTFVLDPAGASTSAARLDDEIGWATNYVNAYKAAYPSIIAPLEETLNSAKSVRNNLWFDKAELDAAYEALHAAGVTAQEEIEKAQGISNVQSDNVQCTKVLRDGKLFIESNGRTFNAQGTEVK